jgi:hypothetical protein
MPGEPLYEVGGGSWRNERGHGILQVTIERTCEEDQKEVCSDAGLLEWVSARPDGIVSIVASTQIRELEGERRLVYEEPEVVMLESGAVRVRLKICDPETTAISLSELAPGEPGSYTEVERTPVAAPGGDASPGCS